MVELSEILLLLLINSLSIIGIYKAGYYLTDKEGEPIEDTKMVLWKAKFYSLKYLGEFWSKPIITCPTCMASLHSTYVFSLWSFMYGFEPIHIIIYFIYVAALAAAVNVVANFTE